MCNCSEVPKLKDILYDVVSTNVAEELRKHVKNNNDCEYCIYEPINTECDVYKNIKELLRELPDTIKTTVHSKLYQLLQRDLTHFNPRRFEIMYLITWFCENPNLEIQYQSYSDGEDILFVQKFAKYIRAFQLTRSPEYLYNECFLNSFLNKASNLQVLDFRGISISDNVMKSIGKNCVSIYKLIAKVILGDNFTDVGFQKLLFEDYEHLKKNKCCYSLQVIDVNLHPENRSFYKDAQTRRDTLQMILSNVKNLKNLGTEDYINHSLNEIVSAVNNCPTQIESGCISTLTEELIADCKRLFPELRELVMDSDQSPGALRLLRTLDNLEDLTLTRFVSVLSYSSLYDCILSVEWTTLKRLELRSEGIAADRIVVNIDELAVKLPHLQELSLIYFPRVKWDRVNYFRMLTFFSWNPIISNWKSNWFQSFSRTIREIQINNHSCNQEQFHSLYEFYYNSYPVLEKLQIVWIPFDTATISVILVKCTKLQSLGIIRGSESHVRQFENYMKSYTKNCYCKLLCE